MNRTIPWTLIFWAVVILGVVAFVMTILNENQKVGAQWVQMTAQFTPGRATARPLATATRTPTARRPANCTQARAMGLTEREAGRWSHLDRDNDGLACYGT